MKRMISTIALVSLLSLGLVVSVSYAGAPMGKGGFTTFNSIDLIGARVENSRGRFLGIVNGVTIDSEGHAFAIVNHGDYDLYGPGGANSPVPFAALRISEAKSGMGRLSSIRIWSIWILRRSLTRPKAAIAKPKQTFTCTMDFNPIGRKGVNA